MDDELIVYRVTMLNHAFRDLDGIFEYIAKTLMEPSVALNIVDDIEAAILSLEVMPHRCPERKIGAYAGRGCRQLFVGNYTVLFRIGA